ncbi:MAG: DUF4838 domain-containing protein [Verrucomicrobiaceae bacterium]|nr:DUF4838 domain-containing protein [Verrucomicrobiaceae bacterium]
MKNLPTLFAALLLGSLAPLRAVDTFVIENGKANAEIVVAEKPARMTKLAAIELQSTLAKMSGATLPVVTERSEGKMAIFVGMSKFTEELGLSTKELKHGAFRMASGKDWLALLGPDKDFVPTEPWGRKRDNNEAARVNAEWDKITGDTFWNTASELYQLYHPDLDVWDQDDAGTFNAVNEFLRGFGCRWFAPGEIGEVVPKVATIALPQVNRAVTPDFGLRRFVYYTQHTGIGDRALWNLRLGVNFGAEIVGFPQMCHGMKFVIKREEMQRAHPEMYLRINGKRDTTHKGDGVPDLLSPVLFEKQVKHIRAMFDHFQEPMHNIDLVDGYSGLRGDDPAWIAQQTPERGWSGEMSDHVFGYLNRVALEVQRSHPDRLVSALAYGAYTQPPVKIEKLSPNLALIDVGHRQECWDEGKWKERQQWRADWLKKLSSGKYITWDFSTNARPEQAGRPVYYTKQISRDLRELKGVSLGEQVEIYAHPAGKEQSFGYHDLAIEHFNLYVTARLYWDANQDVNAMLADYCTSYFGPAAEAMKAFISHAEANWMHMNTDAVKIGESFDLLAKAKAAADPASLPGRRIQQISDTMKPLEALRVQLSRKRETDLDYRALETVNTGAKPLGSKPLDGNVDKAYWSDVRIAPLLRLRPEDPQPKASASFQIQREGSTLHIGIVCLEPDMKGLQSPTTKNDDPKLLEGDHVTLLIETSSRSYYEMSINPAGAVYDLDHAPGGKGVDWSSGAKVAVHRGTDRWSVEMRLPIVGAEAFTIDPTKGIDGAQPKELFPWHFNLGRTRVRDGKTERTAFSPTGKDDLHVTEKFAKLWGR